MPTDAARIRGDIDHEIARRGGAARIVIYDHPEKKYLEKRLADIASDLGKTPADAAIHLQMTGYDRAGGARMRGYSLSEIDIEHIMRQDFTATCTDGDTVAYGDGVPHARFYGTMPRKIRRYVVDRGVITLPFAIRSMTSLAAQIMGLGIAACSVRAPGPTSSSSTSRRLPITPPSRSRRTDRHSLRSRQRCPSSIAASSRTRRRERSSHRRLTDSPPKPGRR